MSDEELRCTPTEYIDPDDLASMQSNITSQAPHAVFVSTPMEKGKSYPSASPGKIPEDIGGREVPTELVKPQLPGPVASLKLAPPVPPKMAGKAPPPIPMAKPSIGGKLSMGGIPNRLPGVPAREPVSDLINIHWKPASSHSATGAKRPVSPGLDSGDQFLRPFMVSDSRSLQELLAENPVPGLLAQGSDENGVFASSHSNITGLPQEILKQYFSRKQNNKFDTLMGSSGMSSLREDGGSPMAGKRSALDRERLKLFALSLGGAISSRSNRRLIFRQYREAIVRCDYSVAKVDVITPLQQLLNNVTDEETNSCVEFIRNELNAPHNKSLPEAIVLEDFEEPDVFLFEMSKVPDVKIRLECMILEQTFEDLFQLTLNSLNILYSGLEVISKNLDKISRIFALILRTGNALNEGSKLGAHQTSFCLATLAKLSEVKSSADPRLDILHLILSHCSAEEASLFSDDEIAKLKAASGLRCYRVRDEVKEFLDSVSAIIQIVRVPIPEAPDGDDRFMDRMHKFFNQIRGTDQWLSKYALNVFGSYRNLCMYFEDVKAVYPPPKEKTTEQFDIVELFAWFGGVVRVHEKEIRKRGLRERVGTAHEQKVTEKVREVREKPIVSTPPVTPLKLASVPDFRVAVEPIPTGREAHVPPPVVYPSELPTVTITRSPVFVPTLVAEPASSDVPKVSITQSPIPAPSLEQSSSRRPSLTKEQLHSTLMNLSSPAPPTVALIRRIGSSRTDLAASKPNLSPMITPVIEVSVTPASNIYTGSRATLEMHASRTSVPLSSTGRRTMLILPHSKKDSQGGVSVSVLPPVSLSGVDRVLSPPPRRVDENSTDFFADQSYPSRNHDDATYPTHAMLNSRQSLSNTINRVAQLLSPTKEDGATLYRGTRRNRPSLLPESLPE